MLWRHLLETPKLAPQWLTPQGLAQGLVQAEGLAPTRISCQFHLLFRNFHIVGMFHLQLVSKWRYKYQKCRLFCHHPDEWMSSMLSMFRLRSGSKQSHHRCLACRLCLSHQLYWSFHIVGMYRLRSKSEWRYKHQICKQGLRYLGAYNHRRLSTCR